MYKTTKLVSVSNRKLFIMSNKIKGTAKRTVTEKIVIALKQVNKSAAQNMFNHKKIKLGKL